MKKRITSCTLVISFLFHLGCYNTTRLGKDEFVANGKRTDISVDTRDGKKYEFEEDKYRILNDSLSGIGMQMLRPPCLMVTTTKNNAFGNHMTEAATFAQDKWEELRAIKWENLFDGRNTDQQGGSTGINYTRNWRVTTSGSLKTITIDVNWNDRTAHSIRLVSVLSQ